MRFEPIGHPSNFDKIATYPLREILFASWSNQIQPYFQTRFVLQLMVMLQQCQHLVEENI